MHSSLQHALLAAAFAALTLSSHAQGILQPKPLTLPADMDVAAVKDAGKQAAAEVLAAFVASDAAKGGKSFIIMPLGRDVDQGYFTLQFENAFTQRAGAAGYKLYTRADKVLEQVLSEIEFQQNFSDSIDKTTLQKLALIGAQTVVLPRIDIDKSTSGAVTVRASIGVHTIATAEKTWGDEVSKIIPAKHTANDWGRYGGIGFASLGGLAVLFCLIRSEHS